MLNEVEECLENPMAARWILAYPVLVSVYEWGLRRDRRTEPARRAMTGMDVHQRDDLAFPQSLPEFQRLFPVDAARAAYPERVQFQRQLGLSRYKTAFGILHKQRAGMVRPDQESAASLISMSKLMKPTSAAGPVAKAGASITRFLSPVFCRSPPPEAKYCPG
jgi:hypothetical protein